MTVNISSPLTPTAGDSFNMTCNVIVPERFVDKPTAIIWSYDMDSTQQVNEENSDAFVTNFTQNGSLFFSHLTLSPVKTSDSRRYYCSVIFETLDTTDYTFQDLSVNGTYIIS